MLCLDVHPSQYPHAAQDRLQRALHHRRIPARFLYDSPSQAARWLAYHNAWSPSRTGDGLLRNYTAAFEAVIERLPSSHRFTYVGLGCGGGFKDREFLRRFRSGASTPAVLADTSPSLVVAAMLECTESRPRGLVIDLETQPERNAFVPEDTPAVWTAFGMIPNFEVAPFLRWLGHLLGPRDIALVSANLHPEPWSRAAEAILPQYDNPPARAWYGGGLAELGMHHVRLEIDSRPTTTDETAWRVEVSAHAEANLTVRAFDDAWELPAGASLSVFYSNRFTPEAFERALSDADLVPFDRQLFDSGEEGIWSVQRPN